MSSVRDDTQQSRENTKMEQTEEMCVGYCDGLTVPFENLLAGLQVVMTSLSLPLVAMEFIWEIWEEGT